MIYPNDHRPAHVHAIGPDLEAIYLLHCPGGPPELRESYGFRTVELKDIADVLGDEIDELCAEWERIHDH